MKTETWSMNGLHTVLWQPESPTRAILQVTHGMTEHMGRYETFAAALCSQGIAVAGFDLRGHGKNPGNPEIADFGEGGWVASLEDMRRCFLELQQRFPNVPHYMLGFSLGSFLLREYLGIYPQDVAGAIIAGTGHEPGWLLTILMAIVKGEAKKVAPGETTDLIKQLSFGTYNQAFKPNRTEADWLCSDAAMLDQYLADPLVRKNISAGLFLALLGSMKHTGKPERYVAWNKDMPVLLLYGAEDPVGKAGKGVAALLGMLRKAGMQHLECHPFPHARHDIFHEASTGAADAVRDRIAAWLTNPL